MAKPASKNGEKASKKAFKRGVKKAKTALNAQETTSQAKPYISAYKRAEFAYQKIQEERRAAANAKREEREKREQKHTEYLSLKKKMNKALKKKNKKGQPKLGAQMEVLLEKIERRMKNGQ